MSIRGRVQRLEEARASRTEAAWFRDIPDHVLPEPACYFLTNIVADLRRDFQLEELGGDRLRDLECLGGAGVNAWAAANGLPSVPLGEVTEFPHYGGGVYVTSRHWRPIYALASHAFLGTLTDEEMASVMGTAPADKHLVPGKAVS